jgi:UDP-4-amino-4,6-dideoxy-N-acetyl-beta-L-altrosamine transaminase
MIPYGRQDVTEADIAAVCEVLRSDFLTQGPAVPRFERAVAEHVGAARGVAMNSATSALHVAYAALGMGPGDLLWTVPTTFVATANAALYCGAEVDFVDIDPDRFTMCPDRLAEKFAEAKRRGRLPKIVAPVHMCGLHADMEPIAALARAHGARVVEDASHAIGAYYRGAPVGSGGHADVTVFSFHPVKIVTTGEGGMAMTNDADLADRMERLRSHGITRDPARMSSRPEGPWVYEQIELGWNYRMTDIAAALGLSQFSRLDVYIERREAIVRVYDDALAGLPLRLPAQPEDARSAHHLYVVRLADASRRGEVFVALRDKGVGVNVHYIPVHLQPYYRRLGFAAGMFPASEDYYRAAISLPIYPALGPEAQAQVIAALREALAG